MALAKASTSGKNKGAEFKAGAEVNLEAISHPQFKELFSTKVKTITTFQILPGQKIISVSI